MNADYCVSLARSKDKPSLPRREGSLCGKGGDFKHLNWHIIHRTKDVTYCCLWNKIPWVMESFIGSSIFFNLSEGVDSATLQSSKFVTGKPDFGI